MADSEEAGDKEQQCSERRLSVFWPIAWPILSDYPSLARPVPHSVREVMERSFERAPGVVTIPLVLPCGADGSGFGSPSLGVFHTAGHQESGHLSGEI